MLVIDGGCGSNAGLWCEERLFVHQSSTAASILCSIAFFCCLVLRLNLTDLIKIGSSVRDKQKPRVLSPILQVLPIFLCCSITQVHRTSTLFLFCS